MGGKPLSGIKSIYVDSSGCVRVKGDESEWFRIASGVRQGFIMSPWLFNVNKIAHHYVGHTEVRTDGGGGVSILQKRDPTADGGTSFLRERHTASWTCDAKGTAFVEPPLRHAYRRSSPIEI